MQHRICTILLLHAGLVAAEFIKIMPICDNECQKNLIFANYTQISKNTQNAANGNKDFVAQKVSTENQNKKVIPCVPNVKSPRYIQRDSNKLANIDGSKSAANPKAVNSTDAKDVKYSIKQTPISSTRNNSITCLPPKTQAIPAPGYGDAKYIAQMASYPSYTQPFSSPITIPEQRPPTTPNTESKATQQSLPLNSNSFACAKKAIPNKSTKVPIPKLRMQTNLPPKSIAIKYPQRTISGNTKITSGPCKSVKSIGTKDIAGRPIYSMVSNEIFALFIRALDEILNKNKYVDGGCIPYRFKTNPARNMSVKAAPKNAATSKIAPQNSLCQYNNPKQCSTNTGLPDATNHKIEVLEQEIKMLQYHINKLDQTRNSMPGAQYIPQYYPYTYPFYYNSYISPSYYGPPDKKDQPAGKIDKRIYQQGKKTQTTVITKKKVKNDKHSKIPDEDCNLSVSKEIKKCNEEGAKAPTGGRSQSSDEDGLSSLHEIECEKESRGNSHTAQANDNKTQRSVKLALLKNLEREIMHTKNVGKVGSFSFRENQKLPAKIDNEIKTAKEEICNEEDGKGGLDSERDRSLKFLNKIRKLLSMKDEDKPTSPEIGEAVHQKLADTSPFLPKEPPENTGKRMPGAGTGQLLHKDSPLQSVQKLYIHNEDHDSEMPYENLRKLGYKEPNKDGELYLVLDAKDINVGGALQRTTESDDQTALSSDEGCMSHKKEQNPMKVEHVVIHHCFEPPKTKYGAFPTKKVHYSRGSPFNRGEGLVFGRKNAMHSSSHDEPVKYTDNCKKKKVDEPEYIYLSELIKNSS